MSTLPDKPTGKRIIEDIGGGRAWDWPSIPEGLAKRVPVYGSSTIKCELCGSPWGGLIYDPKEDAFRHRLSCSSRFG